MDVADVRASRAAWEEMAPEFDATRRRPWAPVVEFLESLPPGARVLDAGVGNGRHAKVGVARGLRVTGLDFGRGLLARAGANVPGLARVQGVIERLPFVDDSFDAILAVAVVHHVRGRDRRLGVWRGLQRLLRPGGRAFVSVWALDQPRFVDTQAASGAEAGDRMIPWKAGPRPVDRFVHLYEGPELDAEVLEGGWLILDRSKPALGGVEADNHVRVLRSPM